jgi:sugar lactone lactonase YvrE
MRIFNGVAALWVIFYLFLIACNKGNDGPQPFLTVNTSSLTLAAEGQTDSVIIESSEPWRLVIPSAAATWLFVSKDSGMAGTTTVRLHAIPNSLNSPRSAVVTVISSGAQVAPLSIIVTQTHEVKIEWFSAQEAPGGSTVYIDGRGFSTTPSENIVKINGVTAIVQTSTNARLAVTVPPMCDSGPIEVAVNTKADTSDYDFIYFWIGVVTVVAGDISGGHLDGPVATALFSHPDGIDFDAAGNLYVADYANYKVRKITPAGIVSTLPGRFPAWNNPSGPDTDFGLPSDVAVDAAGNVFVAEFNSSLISKITPAGMVSVFAGSTTTYGNTDGVGTAALFYRPVDIAMDGAGNMFVSDLENHRIRKVTPAGEVTTLAGSTQAFADGTGAGAKFNSPMGIDLDIAGNLYVADYYNNRIRKVTPAGVVTTIAGNDYIGSTNGPVATASFFRPIDLAIDAAGVIYVTEADSDNEIRRITPNGKVNSVTGYVDAVTGSAFHFNGIYGITVDTTGKIFVSDYYNNRICKLTLK